MKVLSSLVIGGGELNDDSIHSCSTGDSRGRGRSRDRRKSSKRRASGMKMLKGFMTGGGTSSENLSKIGDFVGQRAEARP